MTTSFAKTISATPIQADSPQKTFAESVHEISNRTEYATKLQRSSLMVTQDEPHPVPRPSPDMAHGPDSAAFNRRWQDEARQARKAAFITERTDTKTGGRVRNLNRTR
ncbi:MAG: hypothetical protein ACPGOY_11555 [Rhodospirillaceae bacterium]